MRSTFFQSVDAKQNSNPYNKTTTLTLLKNALSEYDAECKKSSAGKPGILRRTQYAEVIQSLEKASDPLTAQDLIPLCKFYRENTSGRLARNVSDALTTLFEIKPFSEISCQTCENPLGFLATAHSNALRFIEAEAYRVSVLNEKIKTIEEAAGLKVNDSTCVIL